MVTWLHTLSSSPKINAETSNRVANLSWDLTMILQKIKKKLCHAIVHCVKYAGLVFFKVVFFPVRLGLCIPSSKTELFDAAESLCNVVVMTFVIDIDQTDKNER